MNYINYLHLSCGFYTVFQELGSMGCQIHYVEVDSDDIEPLQAIHRGEYVDQKLF